MTVLPDMVALAGGRAALPCNTSLWSDETVSMVLWYHIEPPSSGGGQSSQQSTPQIPKQLYPQLAKKFGGKFPQSATAAAPKKGNMPIYTIDARGRDTPLKEGRHLVADQFKGRAHFDPASRPPQLVIDPVEPG